ncbi:ATP-binding protein [Cohnella faecalis]|uniref:histidine kinase n=1 Tax=Cohnella faecalis TaxID=2315694 RepID=A0A398CZ86_9BACL|nr:ATP-binding protein [Cohnella faecalis]RIE04541.1 response regulator [Cohnella faecalis]
MKSTRTLFLYAAVFFIVLVGIRVAWIVFEQPPAGYPSAVRGQLDLRGMGNFGNKTISLKGEWEFYPNRLLMQTTDRSYESGEGNGFIQVPGNWGSSLSPNSKSNLGYGSYRLKILVDRDDARQYGIRILGIAASSGLYVNGHFAAGSGRPAETKQQYKAVNSTYSATFSPVNGEIEIVIQAANFDNSQSGGIVKTVKFGTESAILKDERFSIAMQFLVFVVLAMHALYALIIYTVGTRQRVLLSFGLLVFSAMVMVLTDDDKLLQNWFSVSREWMIKLQFLSLVGVGFFILRFAKELIPEFMFVRAYRIMQTVNAVAATLLLFSSESFALSAGIGVFCILLLSISLFVALAIRMMLSGVENAVFLLCGAFAVQLSCIGGLVKSFGWFEAGFYPVDLLVAFLAAASFWFRRYIQAAAQTAVLSEKLQMEDKRKDDFLANVSHELRNPLHGILNIAQTVLESEQSVIGEKNAQKLELLMTVGRRMTFMLNDLLDLTLLKEQGIRLHLKSLQVQTVATGVIDMLRFMTEGKPIRFENRIPSTFPMVKADESRLIQILFNLLHNAVKYTNEGVITVRALSEGGKATFFVEDTGVGMTDGQQEKIFEPYEQVASGLTAVGNGIGLGLSICKQLVELHGGTINVYSVVGEGSSFFFTLELSGEQLEHEDTHVRTGRTDAEEDAQKLLAAADGEHRDPAWKPMFAAVGSGPKILIVDDDSVNRIVLSNILAAEGCEIATVSSGKEALAVLDSREWDLIIADVMMPIMSGYELTRIIRERFSVSELPILLLTARSRPEDVQTGFLSGANDHITKPMEAKELRSRVRALTELKHSVQDRLRMEAAWLQAQIKPHFLFNTLNSVAALGDFDTTRMRSLLDAFGRYLKASFDFRNSERLVPLDQELQLVRSYLYIEKERFQDRLHVRWEVDDNLRLSIPPLTIQPLVENAVRHGILRRSHGGEVRIRIACIEEGAEIAIFDDGVGMDPDTAKQLLEGRPVPGAGIGLRNADRRLKQIYGKGLRIMSRPGQGTTVSFLIRKTVSVSRLDGE